MRNALKVGLVLAMMNGLVGCSNMNRQEQAALSTGAGGAAVGALAGLLFGPTILLGALIGGAAGAAYGALRENN